MTQAIFIKLLEQEGIRTAIASLFFVFIMYVVYHLFIKKYVFEMKRTIENFSKTIDSNNRATNIVLFCELQRQYYERKAKGGKSINADERWQLMWNTYVDLGDGNGDSLKKDWDKLPII